MHLFPLIVSYTYTLQFADDTKMGGIIYILETRVATVQG